MPKFTLTYNKDKTPEVVQVAVLKNCGECYVADTSAKAVWSLLHAIAYSAVFLIPEAFVEDKTAYSLESICSLQEGMINSVALHTFLERVGSYEEHKHEILLSIITDTLLPEVLGLLAAPIFDVYCALCAAYLLEIGDTQRYTRILKVRDTFGVNKYQMCYLIITD